MLRILYLKWQLAFTEKANRFLFTIKRIKWLGRYISEEWYVRSDVKRILGFLAMAGSFFWDFCITGVYYIALLVFPLWFSQIADIPFTSILTYLFLMMNGIIGSSVYSRIFFFTDEKEYLMLNLMRIPPKQHYMTKLLEEHGKQGIYYTLLLGITMVGIGDFPVFSYIGCMLFYFSMRPVGEAYQLWMNHRYGIPFQQKSVSALIKHYNRNILLVLLAYGYYPLAFLLQLPLPDFENRILWVVLDLIGIVLAAVSIRYLYQYPDYTLVARRLTSYNTIEEKEETQKGIQSSGYEVRDKDVDEEELHAHLFPDKSGYDYMNALFFLRHKRLVRNAVRHKVLVIGGVLLLIIGILLFNKIFMPSRQYAGLCDQIWKMVDRFIGSFIFIMYCASSGQALTQAMFYNCDVSLLKYGYYRTPDVILLNFRIRLRYMVRAELPVMGTLCVGLSGIMLLLGSRDVLQIGTILLCACVLSVFFSIVYLCMYYIFQPYTEGGAQTGMGYRICSTMIYLVSYTCLMQAYMPALSFCRLVLVVTLLGGLAGYGIVYLAAPRTFRLK